MNLYVTVDNTPESETSAVWTTSAGDASKAKTAMVTALKTAELPHRNVAFAGVEVPTTKADLVAFLNVHAIGGVASILALQRLTAAT